MKAIRKVMAVVYDINNGIPYYLILHRVLRWNGWELLKGTVEHGEDLRKAIKREIFEETGLKEFIIHDKLDCKFEWNWGNNRVIVEEVFLVKVDMSRQINLNQRVKEHDAYLWADYKLASEKLTFDNSINVLGLADRKLFK